MKVAIVGGGIAGLYTAWRILTSKEKPEEPIEVTLFECSNRIGGRILSQVIPPLSFRAELGAMRFHPMTQHLLRALIDDLDIRTRPFDVAPPHLYVRGRALSPQEVLRGHCMRCRAGTPFLLRAEERGRSPEDLLSSVLKSLFNDVSFPNASPAEAHDMKERLLEGNYGNDVWVFLRKYGMYENVPLSEIGFWNLVQHYLSNEAFQLVYHALSLDSVIGNWNAAEAIPWFVSDFTGADLWMVPAGMSWIVERMQREIANSPVWKPMLNYRVTKCEFVNQSWAITCAVDEKLEYDAFVSIPQEQTLPHRAAEPIEQRMETSGGFDSVVFAVPLQAYKGMEIFDRANKPWSLPLEDDILSHRLFKAFLLYEHPWWNGGDVPGAATGRTYTDLPLRQIYYFGPDWMKACQPATALQDSKTRERVPAWSPPFTDLLRKWEHEEQATKKDGGTYRQWSLIMASYSDEHHVNFWRPPRHGLEKSAIHFKAPEGMPADEAALLEAEMARIPTHLRLRSRTVRKIQQQLVEIHGQTIEEPVAGVYMDWGDDQQSYGGGWHTWRVGSNAESYYNLKLPDGIHLCGEAFSRDQGWIEGALRTAEYVLDRLEVPPTRRGERYLDYQLKKYVGPATDQREDSDEVSPTNTPAKGPVSDNLDQMPGGKTPTP
jgi:predicted NAD/FAD-dependent oxidoreductase